MRYQQSWEDIAAADVPQKNQANLEATIRRSLELGIHHIETARGYGSSEMQLGWILPKLPRQELIVQTKVSPTKDPCKFAETFEESMRNLQLDHVDLLSIHGINNEETLDWTVREGGCLEVAEKLKAAGRVRHIGFSTHGRCSLITKAIESNRFDYVNLHWYYIFQDNWPAIVAATRLDMGVFIISPNDKGGMLYKPSPKLSRLCQPLSPMAFNDLFCLLRPEVHTLSLGASCPDDFEAHVQALDHLEAANELVPEIEARLRNAAIEMVGEDWLDHMLEGIPHWDAVPGELNIRVMLRLWTLVKCFDMIEYGKARYNLLGNAGHWFPGRNAKAADLSLLPPALRKSRFAECIPERIAETNRLLQADEKKRLSKSD